MTLTHSLSLVQLSPTKTKRDSAGELHLTLFSFCVFVLNKQKLRRGNKAASSREKVKVDNPRTAIWRVANDRKGIDVTSAPVAEITPDEGVI